MEAENQNNAESSDADEGKNDVPVRGEVPMEEAVKKEANEAIVEMPKDVAAESAATGKNKGNSKDLSPFHDRIMEDLENCLTITDVARKYNVTRNTMAKYIHGTEDLQRSFDDAKEKRLDLMEKVVLDIATIDSENQITENGAFARNDGRVMTANLNAAKFWLERQGKRRGWHEKIETEETGNALGRVPMIFLGEVNEAVIAEAEAKVKAANTDAGAGLADGGKA